MTTDNGHVLATHLSCPVREVNPEGHLRRENDCPVCDWGWSVCLRCGLMESELWATPCSGHKPIAEVLENIEGHADSAYDDVRLDSIDAAQAIRRLEAEKAELIEAARVVSARYSELYAGMDSDHAAFFTALGGEVEGLRAVLGKYVAIERCPKEGRG